MSRPGPDIAGTTDAAEAARDWAAIRASGEIQFAPLRPTPPPEPPEWLKALGELLNRLFGGSGNGASFDWPMAWKVLAALGIVLALVLAWRTLLPLIRHRQTGKPEAETGWTPERGQALALLDEADRLAGEGRFSEATHLLLERSVGQIAAARPDLLHPSSTAREIAALASLSGAIRRPFAVIAERVERSLFALRDLDAGDWQVARSAYADFALKELRA